MTGQPLGLNSNQGDVAWIVPFVAVLTIKKKKKSKSRNFYSLNWLIKISISFIHLPWCQACCSAQRTLNKCWNVDMNGKKQCKGRESRVSDITNVWGLTRRPWEDRGGSQLFGVGTCSSLSEAWKTRGSPGTAPREIPSCEPPTFQFQQKTPALSFCS